MRVTTIRLPASNVHLLTGRTGGQVLVDAGTHAAVPRLRRELARLGVTDPRRLAAVVLTHGHADHAGGARRLVGDDVPVLLGRGDLHMVRAGRNDLLVPTSLTARLVRPFVDTTFPGWSPDVLVDREDIDLAPYGVDAVVVPASAHTAGSLVVCATGRDAPMVVGDLVRGGHLGGALRPALPLPHYFSAAPGRDREVLSGLLAAHQPSSVHVGHGGPVDVAALHRLLDLTAPRRRISDPSPPPAV